MALLGNGEFWSAVGILMLLVGGAAIGHLLLPRVPARHRSIETIDTVRLVSSFAVTFAALVLGLLTASVNTAFSIAGQDMDALAGSIRQTDSCLASYGPETAPIRGMLRSYAAGVVASTWPEEPPPEGDYPKDPRVGQKLESLALGDVLQRVRVAILDLQSRDPGRQALATVCSTDFGRLSDNRWKLIGEARNSVSVPFYRLLVAMLMTVFVGFGLIAPRNPLALAAILIAATTIASAAFVVLELDGPLDGVIKVSSAAMRETLAHFGP